jgi:hypothetical protein
MCWEHDSRYAIEVIHSHCFCFCQWRKLFLKISSVSVNYKIIILQCKVQKKFYDTVPKIPDHKAIGGNNILQSRKLKIDRHQHV